MKSEANNFHEKKSLVIQMWNKPTHLMMAIITPSPWVNICRLNKWRLNFVLNIFQEKNDDRGNKAKGVISNDSCWTWFIALVYIRISVFGYFLYYSMKAICKYHHQYNYLHFKLVQYCFRFLKILKTKTKSCMNHIEQYLSGYFTQFSFTMTSVLKEISIKFNLNTASKRIEEQSKASEFSEQPQTSSTQPCKSLPLNVI